MINAPSGGAPEKAPRRDLTGTEGCGGGNRVLAPVLMVWGYIGIYIGGRSRSVELRGAHEGGGAPTPWARPPSLWPPHGVPDFYSKSPVHVSSKKIAPKDFIPFGLRLIFLFFETLKQAKNNKFRLGLQLVG